MLAVSIVVAADDEAEPTAPPAARRVMARVNGEPIYMDALIDMLLRGPGMSHANQLIRYELVRREAEKAKIVVTDADIAAETDRILKAMVPQAQTPQERESTLAQLLVQKKISRTQWVRGVRLGAQLRKLVESRVKISDQMLRKQFHLRYGGQVVVREIKASSLERMDRILQELQDGADFAKLAWKRSTSDSARNGGLLDPIAPESPNVHRAILAAALALSNVGEVSDTIQIGTSFHILKLESIIEPRDVKFEDIRAQLRSAIREEMIRAYQGRLLGELVSKARVEFVDPVLKELDAQKKGAS